MQKKFTRKPKTVVRPTPITSFQDYTRAMTPLDRYRKHYVLFEYWDAEFRQTLGQTNANTKRIKRASTESLAELRTICGMLKDEDAASLQPILEERGRLDEQIQRGLLASSRQHVALHVLEQHARQINRDLFWRHVEDRLKPAEPAASDAAGH